VPNSKEGPGFRAVIDANYARVHNLLLRLVGDREAAADLTQDTFVRAYQAWEFFRGDSQVYTWLFRIAVNLARNHLEKQGRERRQVEPELSRAEEMPARRFSRPDEVVQRGEMAGMLAEELLALREDQREIIVLRDVQDLTYEEIAQVLGCSVSAVKSKLFRARSALRRRLGPYLGWEA
jgi:RNA polymerase sigma-70 factor (ECF subfamily)